MKHPQTGNLYKNETSKGMKHPQSADQESLYIKSNLMLSFHNKKPAPARPVNLQALSSHYALSFPRIEEPLHFDDEQGLAVNSLAMNCSRIKCLSGQKTSAISEA